MGERIFGFNPCFLRPLCNIASGYKKVVLGRFQSLFSQTPLQPSKGYRSQHEAAQFQSLFSQTPLQPTASLTERLQAGVSILVFLDYFATRSIWRLYMDLSMSSFNPCFLRPLCNITSDIQSSHSVEVSILVFVDSFATMLILSYFLMVMNSGFNPCFRRLLCNPFVTNNFAQKGMQFQSLFSQTPLQLRNTGRDTAV